nr:10911_t:CDS:1 [Entrophospora candida]
MEIVMMIHILLKLYSKYKYGTDIKDKYVIVRMQKFKVRFIVFIYLINKGVDNGDDTIIDYNKYERLAISESSESSDSNNASDSEEYSNQSRNEPAIGFMNLNVLEENYVNDIHSK